MTRDLYNGFCSQRWSAPCIHRVNEVKNCKSRVSLKSVRKCSVVLILLMRKSKLCFSVYKAVFFFFFFSLPVLAGLISNRSKYRPSAAFYQSVTVFTAWRPTAKQIKYYLLRSHHVTDYTSSIIVTKTGSVILLRLGISCPSLYI